ncbi:DUF1273 domain-containing protein [Bacillus haynesii]|uniref:SLOG family protein n=1 Tax=Bacillus haynesii TaxID=1925021 RepID=UPI00228092B5|nr:SLOG family protein [Bacillus haynesii]MCY8549487.1 DUF1273 domain-containing protein [Bacillus haynesii]
MSYFQFEINFDKTLAFTGHRPDKLFGYDPLEEGNMRLFLKLKTLVERLINRRGIDTFVSGMALGSDMWSAQVVLSLRKKYPHIKLICAVPCMNQSEKWKREDKDTYHNILKDADHICYISKENYTPWCMQRRNEWMIDNSKFLIAIWDGVEAGGTWNTVKYANKRQRSIIRLDPKSLSVTLQCKKR